jgi:trimeric autotransporter adhesin
MKQVRKLSAVTVAALLVAIMGTAYAQQPPDVVQSDFRANTAMGTNALFSNVTGGQNNATGTTALFSNTTGFGNNAYGYEAMYSNTTGGGNSAFGGGALEFNTTGYQNTAVGNSALAYTSRQRNERNRTASWYA